MKTKHQIETELAALRARLAQDAFEDCEETGEPDWVDTSNRITALEWVLGLEGAEDEL